MKRPVGRYVKGTRYEKRRPVVGPKGCRRFWHLLVPMKGHCTSVDSELVRHPSGVSAQFIAKECINTREWKAFRKNEMRPGIKHGYRCAPSPPWCLPPPRPIVFAPLDVSYDIPRDVCTS